MCHGCGCERIDPANQHRPGPGTRRGEHRSSGRRLLSQTRSPKHELLGHSRPMPSWTKPTVRGSWSSSTRTDRAHSRRCVGASWFMIAAMTDRTSRQPPCECTTDGESNGRERIGEVPLRPRVGSSKLDSTVEPRGGNTAYAP